MRLIIRLLFVLLIIPYASHAASHVVDSLYAVLAKEELNGDVSAMAKVHMLLGKELAHKSQEKYEESIIHFDSAASMALSISDYELAAEALSLSGKSHKRKNNFQIALKKYNQVIAFDKGLISEKTKGRAYSQISSIYQALGNYEKAYASQMQGLLISEVNGDSLGIANSHYNIGTIFFYQMQYEKSLDSYQKAAELCEELNVAYNIYSCLAALGAVHAKLGNHEASLDYNHRSLELAEQLNYRTGIAYAKGNIGSNFITQKKYEQAEDYHLAALALKTELGDTYGVIGNQVEMARLYLEWQKNYKAKSFLEEALQAAIQLNARSRQSDIYKTLAEVYDQLQQPLVAYDYTKKYVAIKDSLLNEKTLEEMGQSKRRFEVEKSEHEIEMLKKENEILGKNEEIRKQQIYLFAITTIAILLFLLWNRNKLKYQNKVNKLLEEKNELLNSKNAEIHIKNKQLEHSNEDLQQFAYVASHDLKEPLRMINSYTKLLKRRHSASFDEVGNEFMHYIVDAVDRMEILLNDLLDFSRAGSQETPEHFVPTSDIMVLVAANLRHALQSQNATLTINSDNLPMIKAHRTQLIQLFQNLVSNGIKFRGENDPIVIVDAFATAEGYVFTVKDNGIGISERNVEKVFEMFRRLHTRDEYEGTGIGLATCKRIVSSWGGEIWLESVEGEGSTFFFSVPSMSIKPNEKIPETAFG